jgi:HEAT repeat protein
MVGDRSADELPSDDQVRYMLTSGASGGESDRDRHRATLIKLGERLFPAYERILADKLKYPREVIGILYILPSVKADRTRFVEHAVELLAVSAPDLRMGALHLLAVIGQARDAAPVVALLSDERRDVAFAAATTLEAIGGPRELTAFDVWLSTSSNRKKDDELRQHVAECRYQLKKRLDKQKKAPK